MIIRNPINPYPQNIAVDPNKAFLKFTFMGDRLGSYRIKIYSYSNTEAESLVGDSGIINLNDYVYNNTEIQQENKLSEMKVVADKSYTWEVEMSPDYNLGAQTSTQFNFTSTRYFFQAVTTPKITATPNGNTAAFSINGTSVEYVSTANLPHIEVNNLQNRHLSIVGYYQNGNIKYYYFELFDEEDNLIETTPKTFSSKIKYDFSGLLPSKNYTLYCYTVSQNDQYANVIFDITTTYTSKEDINYPPVLICNENEANVKIKWIKDSTAAGRATGKYSIQDGKVKISSGKIVYDNISSFPITMDKNNFAVGIKTTINDNTTKIFDYVNNGILYQIYMENYVFYLKYGYIDSANPYIQECGNFKSNIVFGIQNYANPILDTGYMWFSGEEYSISNNDTTYLLVSEREEKKYSILLQNNNGVISCTFDAINE